MLIRELFIEDKSQNVGETTTAGDFASVANPNVAHAKSTKKGKYGAPEAPQKKNANGTAKNALELDDNLMGGKPIRR